jgi:hypothetical protein
VYFFVLPRQTFGKVQSVLFPKYFQVRVVCERDKRQTVLVGYYTTLLHHTLALLTQLTTGCNAILLATTLLSGTPPLAVSQQAIVLGVALAASLANQLYIEPLATELMFERYAIENKEQKSTEDQV